MYFVVAAVVVQSLSPVPLFPISWTAARYASLSFTISRSLLKFMSTESVMLCDISSSTTPFSFYFQSSGKAVYTDLLHHDSATVHHGSVIPKLQNKT